MVVTIPLIMREWIIFPFTGIMTKRAKKRNFTDTKIEVLVGGVETKIYCLEH